MPCSGEGYRESELTQKLNEVTRLLCLACAELDKAQVPVDPEIQYWYYEHRLHDARRVRQQDPTRVSAELSQAIATLTRLIQRDEADLKTAEANGVEEGSLLPHRMRIAAWESRRTKHIQELAALLPETLPSDGSGDRVTRTREAD